MAHGERNRDFNFRRHQRYVKGIRRLRDDRAKHGGAPKFPDATDRLDCECLSEEAGRGVGADFARFADTPTRCSNPFCCGNPRQGYGSQVERLTIQERRAGLGERDDWPDRWDP